MAALAPSPSERIDPRIRRTRQMLLESLEHLLESKGIDDLSVSDITEAATLNRATFYDHYPDKFALLEGLVASQFQLLLNKRGVVFDGSCSSALMAISLATCDYLAGLPGIDCPSRRQMERHFEPAIIAVVCGMILSGLREHPPQNRLAPELIAATISGAIYGAAREWIRTPDRAPASEFVSELYTLIGPMLNH